MKGIWPSRMPGRLSLACAGAVLLWLGPAGAFATLAPVPQRPPASVRATQAAGTPRRMTFLTAPTTAGAAPEVMLADANGSNPQPLGSASTAVLSPNGEWVAAVSPGAGSPPHGSSLVLYRVSKAAAAPRVLRSSTAQLTILDWSPDNRWVAVLDDNSLVVVPLKGKARTIATGTISGASFAPAAPDRLVFAKAASLLVTSPVNLYTVSLKGGGPVAITNDGLSEYPLWGPTGIVFSREASHTATTYQLWLVKPDGRDIRQLTDVTVSAPFFGLEPVAVSADGQHLLANLVGNGITEAWIVDLAAKPPGVRELGVAGSTTIGNAISRNGGTILLTEGLGSLSGSDFTGQSIASVPWSGGTPTTLAVHAAFASWDR